MLEYTPPNAEDLAGLKERLGYTGADMAELASVAGGSQWRKYTGGEARRDINLHIAFFVAARLALTTEQLRAVCDEMARFGAHVDAAQLVELPQKKSVDN